MASTKGHDVEAEAFCLTCPDPQDVTDLLQALGFHLTFQMEAIIYPNSSQTPDLPAQYHYSDAHGTEVMYLAGHDVDMDGLKLPHHASRFWLSPGADLATHQRVAHLLAATWSFTWLYPSEAQELQRTA